MFLNVLSLLVGFLCLFVVLVMLFNTQSNLKKNGYFLVILLVVGLQRFLYAIEILGFTNMVYCPLKIKPILAFYIIPIYYLFFIRLIYDKGNLKKELLHFIFPTLLILLNFVINDFRVNRFVYLAYSVGYFAVILYAIKQFLFRKKQSIMDRISYKVKRTWLFLMVTLVFLLVIYSNCFSFKDLSTQMNLDTFYRYSSLIWFIILLYMFKNPVIIFGEHSLLKNIQLNEPQDFEIWNHKSLKAIEDKDMIVYNTIINKIDFVVMEIKSLQKSTPLISKTTLNAETLAKELKIPKRHLDFIFKYYCNYTINDYSNLIKINYALSLISNGYLDKYTVDSLGKQCLFNSRFTFSKNFKKFVGVSVSNFSGKGSNAVGSVKDYTPINS
ncbi:helix-turn-helix domain-containing protein [Pedobacter alpinus]|uniref:Helix-turn-helix domain-containing protein n=1 Tax=Pedobacter alpinus TaxID=1590643 RepID=A0ABW5TQU7_9SPHI